MPQPRDEYARRLRQREASGAANARRRWRVGMARFAVFLVGVLIVYGALTAVGPSGWWVLLPVAGFFFLGARLTRLEEENAELHRAQAFYRRALARVGGRWAGAGTQGRRFLDDAHLYAGDLDLFGRGSLFELLCLARTRIGEETLAAWLAAPAAPDVVRQRQESVRELSGMLDLREDVAVVAERARDGVHAARLAAWGEAEPMLRAGSRWWLWPLTAVGFVTLVVALLAAGAFIAAANGDARYAAWFSPSVRAYLVAALLVFGGIEWRFRERAEVVFAAANDAANDVGLLAGVLRRIEQDTFTTPLLARLRADLDTDGQPPSQRIRGLNRLMEFVYQRDNLMVRLLGPLLLWDVHLAHALENWRAASGRGMRRWLDVVGQVEALSSMAAYHYERPADVFPELVESDGGTFIEASGIAHPLLPADKAVANDVRLGGEEASVWVVSGSNMSGKSTLLRTLGASVALAQAGAPVRATRLRLSPLRLGASIRVTDSLQDGESRFYAEILRLRAIVEAAAGEPPVLFLIDEFLHGTNSHDRRIGAAAIVHGLVERGALGLVTTHDLALTHIGDELGARGANVHFEDHLEEGEMSFDYQLRSGVVEKSNALELMRSVGLDV